MKKIYISAFIIFCAIVFQVQVHASCYSEYRGNYQDSNVKLIIKTTHSSGKTSTGFYSNQTMVFKFEPKNNNVSNAKIVINNILYYLKEDNSVRIRLYRSMKNYNIKLLYTLPNKDKNAPRWKRKIKVIKDLIITRESKGGCHYTGVLTVKQGK